MKLQPHLLFVLADDFGWNNWQYRNPDLISPTLDQLAQDGVLLDHHYVYKFCSPSRSSLISGRLPMHVNQENSATEQPLAGIPASMTTFPEMLKSQGYRTAQIGKWHCGMASPRVIPHGRGFDSSLGFFNFGEDHYTQIRGGEALDADGGLVEGSGESMVCGGGVRAVDLWKTDAPAFGMNGTYGGYLYTAEALRVIRAHDSSTPLFMFIAWQNNHPPLQVPAEYVARQKTAALRTAVNGMTTFLDEAMANVTGALRDAGMWERTLLVFSGDNGGYLGQGGDNTPLRAGKFSDFQGGVRVPAFVAGGLLPSKLRGTTLAASVHIADWAATFLELAGGHFDHDARAAAATPPLPQPDSLSLALFLLGTNDTTPRTEVPLSVFTPSHRAQLDAHGPSAVAARHARSGGPRDLWYYVGGEALIVGEWKLVLGVQHDSHFSRTSNVSCDALTPPTGPGWDSKAAPGVPCTCGRAGCLFNLQDDPDEKTNLILAHPRTAARLSARLDVLRDSVYAPDRGPIEQAACDVVGSKWGGFWGPWEDH